MRLFLVLIPGKCGARRCFYSSELATCAPNSHPSDASKTITMIQLCGAIIKNVPLTDPSDESEIDAAFGTSVGEDLLLAALPSWHPLVAACAPEWDQPCGRIDIPLTNLLVA